MMIIRVQERKKVIISCSKPLARWYGFLGAYYPQISLILVSRPLRGLFSHYGHIHTYKPHIISQYLLNPVKIDSIS